MLAALADHDPTVRSCAVHSLGLVGTVAVGPALEAIVANRAELARVRGDALEALAALPFRAAAKTIVAAASDPEAEVRFFAANAIAHLGLAEALPVLRALERHEEATLPTFGAVRKEIRSAIDHLETHHRAIAPVASAPSTTESAGSRRRASDRRRR